MAKFEFCRICFVDNVRMFKMDDSHLQGVYKKLTDIPFVTEDSRPMLACYFCYAKLKQCSRFMMKCLEAEERFAQMLDKNNKNASSAVKNNEFISDFVTTPTENFNVYYFEHRPLSTNNSINSNGTDVINVKEEDDRDDEFINREQHDGDADMANIINEIDKDINAEEHILDIADVEEDRNGAPAAKKSKLHIPKECQEVAVSSKPKLNKLRNTKIRCKRAPATKKPKLDKQKESQGVAVSTKSNIYRLRNTNVRRKSKSRANTSVSKIIKPITRNSMRKSKMNNSIKNKVQRNAENATTNTNTVSDISKNNHETINCNDNNYDKKRDSLCHSKVTIKKRHKCNVCLRSFSQKCNLQAHTRIHTGEKPYKCHVCQRSFNQKTPLKTHIRIHTGEKPYKCDICQSSFKDKGVLIRHIRIHTGEKPYKCDICQSSFVQKNGLRTHIRIHTGEKPYKCDVCQCSFNQVGHLRKHIRTHT